ncbi:MAG: sigma 54-interacting transcriptional regulator [Hyphomonadaceae bacterium]
MAKPTILVAEDDAAIRLVISQTLTSAGYAVRTTASIDALQRWVRNGEGDVIVTDVYLDEDLIFDVMPAIKMERPELPIIVMSGQNTILTAASAAEHGAFDYLPKPFDIEALSDLVERALKKPGGGVRRIDRETRKAEQNAVLPLIGRSEQMQDVYRVVSRIMNTNLTVLIEGEAGSGKELTARAIQNLGQYADAPFIMLDLDGVNADEMTDAFASIREDVRSTVYIDEVAGLSADAQARLVRLLRRPGHARLIVSTSHDLDQSVVDGVFRRDLFYRLNIIRLSLPPIRDRKEDIPELAQAFLVRARDSGLPAKRLDAASMDLLTAYDWPGNVRELENIILRLCALSPDEMISARDVEMAMSIDLSRLAPSSVSLEDEFAAVLKSHIMPKLMAVTSDESSRIHQDVIASLEKPLIVLALSITSGNKVRAASLLGVNRNTLRAKMKSLGFAEDD